MVVGGAVKRKISAMASPMREGNETEGHMIETPQRQSTQTRTPLAPKPGKSKNRKMSNGQFRMQMMGSGLRDDDSDGGDGMMSLFENTENDGDGEKNGFELSEENGAEFNFNSPSGSRVAKRSKREPLMGLSVRNAKKQWQTLSPKVDLFKVVAHLQLRQLRLALENGDCTSYFLQNLKSTAEMVTGGSSLEYVGHLVRESLALAACDLSGRDGLCDKETLRAFSVALGHLEGLSRLEMNLITVRGEALTRIRCVYLPYISGLLEFLRTKANNAHHGIDVLETYASQIEDNFRRPLVQALRRAEDLDARLGLMPGRCGLVEGTGEPLDRVKLLHCGGELEIGVRQVSSDE